jgi:uncharacterized glyoxalase superfamily protein PhnB
MEEATKKPPEGWPRISSGVFYQDAAKAIDWLCRAFGFEVRLKVEGENGSVVHSELVFGEGLIMLAAGANPARPHCKSPQSLGGANTQSLAVSVDDVDAHGQRARAAGAQIVQEPETRDYGEEYWADRSYEAVDPEGHHWWFVQRVRDPKPRAQ